jgi:hypothetical protein
MTLTELTFLILNLNSLVDGGHHEATPMEEAKEHIDRGDVFEWLSEKFKGHIDLSIYRADGDARREITKGLHDILGAYRGRERRKWGVENNGICLLIAWVNELVQQRAFKLDRAA